MDPEKTLKDLIQYVPLLGTIIAAFGVIYTVNELINKYSLEKVNPLKSLIKSFPAIRQKRLNQKQKIYYDTITGKEYQDWLINIFDKVYNEFTLVKILGKIYPVICLKIENTCEYPFNNLLDVNKLTIDVTDFKLNKALQLEYQKILGNTIKRPKLKGYMLNELALNSNNEIISISAKTGTFEQNVYTSHILEYELYKLFISKNKNIDNLSKNQILSKLPLRKAIHQDKSQQQVLTTGVNRFSLLGVQIFIFFKDSDDQQYKTLLIKRSEDVSAKPGFYQFIPSGGFEIWQIEESDFILKNNFSVRLALFRELIEEVFGEEEFIDNKSGLPESNILKHPIVLTLLDMIQKKEAFFEFLGSTVDLVGLRHELSFALRIDNVNFSKLSFKSNHESKYIQTYTIDDIINFIPPERLNPASAGLFYFIKNHYLYNEIKGSTI